MGKHWATTTGIVVALAFFLLSISGPSSGQPLVKKRVIIENDLGNGTAMSIMCRSKHDDLGGWRVLADGAKFSWSFKNTLFGNTLFWCAMQWHRASGDVSGSLQAYDAHDDADRCRTNCSWKMTPRFAYSYSDITGVWEPVVVWKI